MLQCGRRLLQIALTAYIEIASTTDVRGVASSAPVAGCTRSPRPICNFQCARVRGAADAPSSTIRFPVEERIRFDDTQFPAGFTAAAIGRPALAVTIRAAVVSMVATLSDSTPTVIHKSIRMILVVHESGRHPFFIDLNPLQKLVEVRVFGEYARPSHYPVLCLHFNPDVGIFREVSSFKTFVCM